MAKIREAFADVRRSERKITVNRSRLLLSHNITNDESNQTYSKEQLIATLQRATDS